MFVVGQKVCFSRSFIERALGAGWSQERVEEVIANRGTITEILSDGWMLISWSDYGRLNHPSDVVSAQ